MLVKIILLGELPERLLVKDQVVGEVRGDRRVSDATQRLRGVDPDHPIPVVLEDAEQGR